ncbi:MAG: flagellar basal body L-ring protein FlgH [Planctomycetota bacterium]|nr:flagellar basal body L-ring protein FlgH [Planctomycetota bacterium]
MMKRNQTPLIGGALMSLALTTAVSSAQQSATTERENPTRKAFTERDISLEKAVRESRQRDDEIVATSERQFPVDQPEPGRAARARTSMGMAKDFKGLFSPMPLKTWSEHDQITIVVIEAARVTRSQELETETDTDLAVEVAAWTDFFNAGTLFTQNSGDNLPKIEAAGAKGFDGEGDYGSKEEITFRTTATVIEVLPNGNLVLQSRHTTKTDNEMTVKTITGICDPRHIAPDDTLLHWRLYDLDLNIQNSGFVKEAANKGFFSQVADFVFNF